MSLAYCINDADIISDMIDGEGFIINTKTGKYYLMNETGAVIWSLIQKGFNISYVVDAIAARFKIELQNVKAHVDSFLARLLDEKLILPQESAVAQTVPADGVITSSMDMYMMPALNIFADFVDDAFACS